MGKKNKELTREQQRAAAEELNALLDAAMRGEEVPIDTLLDAPEKKKSYDDDFDSFKDSLLSAAIGALQDAPQEDDFDDCDSESDEPEEEIEDFNPTPWKNKVAVVTDPEDDEESTMPWVSRGVPKNTVTTTTTKVEKEEIKIVRKPIIDEPDEDDVEEFAKPEEPNNFNIPDVASDCPKFIGVDTDECVVDIYRGHDQIHVCELDTYSLTECTYDYDDPSFLNLVANLETAICFIRKPDVIAFADTVLDENGTTFGSLMKRVANIDKTKWIISKIDDVECDATKTRKTCYVVYYMSKDSKEELNAVLDDLKVDDMVLDFMVNIVEMAKSKLFNPLAYDLNRRDYLSGSISYEPDLQWFKKTIYDENNKSLVLDFGAEFDFEQTILHAEYQVLMDDMISFQESLITYMASDMAEGTEEPTAPAEVEISTIKEETQTVSTSIDSVEVDDVDSDDIELTGVNPSQMIDPIRI